MMGRSIDDYTREERRMFDLEPAPTRGQRLRFAAIVTAAVACLCGLSYCAPPAFAQEDPPNGPKMLTMSRACFPVEDIDFSGVSAKPVFLDDTGWGWVVLHDTKGDHPDMLVALVERDGDKFVCLMATEPGKHS